MTDACFDTMADDQIPLKEGFLWFFVGDGVLGQSEESWQKKYCRLFRRSEAGLNRVEVFNDEKIDFPEHVISLEACLAISKGQSHQLTFFVAKESKLHYFRVDSIGEQKEWLDDFRRIAFQKENVKRTVPLETESATANEFGEMKKLMEEVKELKDTVNKLLLEVSLIHVGKPQQNY